MTRALIASLCIATALVTIHSARAGEAKTAGQEVLLDVKAPQPTAARPAPTVKQATVPRPEILLSLIRTNLIALDQAVHTGNFTVLRDLGAPAFRAANSPAQLGVIFAALRNRNVDLSPATVISPELSEPPQITKENLLRLVGYFPTKPLQIQFQLLLQQDNGRWRLFGIAVHTASPNVAMLPATPAR